MQLLEIAELLLQSEEVGQRLAGCSSSLKALMTGTLAYVAISSTVAWLNVRSTMMSIQRSRLWAIS